MSQLSNSTKTYTLNNGNKIPAVGLGTWQSSDEDAYNAVIAALEQGYRHIDTALVYDNEEAVGRAIKDSKVPREEIFVTTKLWSTDHANPEAGISKSLKNLGLDYVDLYLIHWPVALNPNGNNPKFPSLESGKRDIDNSTNPVEVYSKLQAFVKDGRAKSIGVSNFSIKNLKKVLDAESTTIKPVVNQVELHPYLPQPELLKFAKQNDIYLEAYSPLGSTDSPFYKDETLIELGKKYDAPVATILISWAEARDTIVLPKSVTPSRIESNLKVVKLDSEDIEKINNLHKSHGIKRLVDPDFSPVVIFDTSD